jgi:CheY-like chemotaxis protein
MARHNVLLVDDDEKGLKVLEVSLRNAGFSVTTAHNGAEALAKAETARPALFISDTHMPVLDGYEFCRRVKADERFGDVPFIFLTDQTSIEDKIRGLELGVDDYLTKPIYIKELITRVRIVLQRRERASLESEEKRRFFGSLEGMGVVDLLQTIEMGRKSGTIAFDRKPFEGKMWFANGQITDATCGELEGEEAVYRLLTWEKGSFEIEFRPAEEVADHAVRIRVPTQGLLMEGMRRVDEWGRMLEQLPSIDAVFQVDFGELSDRLAELPDEVNALLRLFDGHRTAMQVVNDSSMGDLDALGAICRLYFEGVIYEVTEPPRTADASREPPRTPPPATTATPDAATAAPVEEWLQQARDGELATEAAVVVPARADAAGEPDAREPQVPAAEPAAEPAAPPTPRGGDLIDDLLESVRADEGSALPADIDLGGGPGDEKDARTVRDALGLRVDDFDAGALAVPPSEPDASEVVDALLGPPGADEDGDSGGLPPSDEVHDTAKEADFFAEGEREEEEDLAPLPDTPVEPTGPAAYVALGLLIFVVVSAIAFFGLRDTVEPREEAAGALVAGWHREVLKERSDPDSLRPIDAGWVAFAAPDVGPAPVADAALDLPDPEPERAPEQPPEVQENFSEMVKEGIALHNAGRYDQAVRKFEEALAVTPTSEEGLLAYAQSLLELGRSKEALKASEKVVRINPRNARAHLIIGSVQQELGRKEAAVEAYQRYLKLAPDAKYADDVRAVLRRMN